MLPKETPLDPSDISPAASALPFFASKMVNLSENPDFPLQIHLDLLTTKAPRFQLSAIPDHKEAILARFVEWAYTDSYSAKYSHPKLNIGLGEMLDAIDEATLHVEMIAFADKYGILRLSAYAQNNFDAVTESHVGDYALPWDIKHFVDLCDIAVETLGVNHLICQNLARLTVSNLDAVRAADILNLFLNDQPEFAVAMVKYFDRATALHADSWSFGRARDGHRDSSVVGREQARRAFRGEPTCSLSHIDDPSVKVVYPPSFSKYHACVDLVSPMKYLPCTGGSKDF